MSVDFSAYKILIVDDIPTNTLLLEVMLSMEGFQTQVAHGGQEALDYLQSDKADLILLDVLMPDISGFELAEILGKSTVWKEIPILFITALDAPNDVVKGFTLGAHDFISKPFNKEELLARIKHQISLIEAKKTILAQTEELRKVIEGRDKLYSVIAHDLRTPMSSLKMMLNAMTLHQEEMNVSADCEEMLKTANEIAEELFFLLDNLLKWTKSQLGRIQPVPQSINLPELTQGLIDIYSTIASLKKIHINLASPPQAEVFVDIDMLKTVIRNLLSNAVKFSYPESQVEVKISISGDNVELNVSDRGCGISKEDQEKLLKVSTHYTSYGTANEEGSGLGLLLTSEFLRYNNSHLQFESKEGTGSTFGFTLPLFK